MSANIWNDELKKEWDRCRLSVLKKITYRTNKELYAINKKLKEKGEKNSEKANN